MFYQPIGPYRKEVVDHEIPVRLVGPDGDQSRLLSLGLDVVRRTALTRHEGNRYNGAFVWALNQAERAIPDCGARFTSSVDGCREVVDAFIGQLEDVEIKSTPARDSSYWVIAPKAIYSKISDALTAIGIVTDALASMKKGPFRGRDPSKVDKSRTPDGAAKVRGGQTFRLDTNRRVRLAPDETAAPRCDDPRMFDRLVEGLEETGAHPVFRRIVGGGHSGGARAKSLLTMDLYGAFVAPDPDKPRLIKVFTKGSKNKRSGDLILSEEEYEALMEWIAGPLAKMSGLTIEEIRRIAANPKEQHKLVGKPVFTEDGVKPIKYKRLWMVIRKAAMAKDLFFNDETYRKTGVKRWLTFHLLRHEYVHRRLDKLYTMDPKDQPAEREAIMGYMGWSRRNREAMLDWYSAHHTAKIAYTSAIEFNGGPAQELPEQTERRHVMSQTSRELVRGL